MKEIGLATFTALLAWTTRSVSQYRYSWHTSLQGLNVRLLILQTYVRFTCKLYIYISKSVALYSEHYSVDFIL